MRRTVYAFVLILGLFGGCYAESDLEYPYVEGPDLAYVAPGVEVVVGYDYPLFFADGFYWLWWSGAWYSSPYWNHGWAPGRHPPHGIRGIPHPERYAHFRPSPSYAMRRAPGYST
ncbi:MAG TPA: hypothetical protein VG871_08375, partial [Vicinamibacterales bacterium]|nr:hypothetical protein [Vicinamibacterales bacterium]